jgi:hypothetical protein
MNSAGWELMALGPRKAEEFAIFAARLDYAVGHEGELLALVEPKAGFGVGRVFSSTEGQAAFNGHLCAASVGRDVAGIGYGESSVRVGAENQAGCESAPRYGHEDRG